MSVVTDANRKIDETRKHVHRAIECLSEVVGGKVWGHDEYCPEWHVKFDEVFVLLRTTQRVLHSRTLHDPEEEEEEDLRCSGLGGDGGSCCAYVEDPVLELPRHFNCECECHG